MMALPLLFTAAMTLGDATNSIVMTRLYTLLLSLTVVSALVLRGSASSTCSTTTPHSCWAKP